MVAFAAADADDRGIADGDIVRLFNDRGACLVGVSISATLMPGVLILPTGAWFTPGSDEHVRMLELAGNPNVLTSDYRASRLSQGTAANSCLINAESIERTIQTE